MNIGTAFILIRNGASIKQIDGAGGIPITRIETIANKVIDRNRMGYANIYNEDKYSSYFLRDGDILMSHINSIQHLGKVAIYHPKNENEKIIHGMNLLVLRANQKLMDNQFAYFYFSSESFLRKLPRITKKSVNQASFTVSELKKIDIPCPSLSQQRRIANILSIVQNLCDKRNQQLRTFDELVKSRFLEMFGDPQNNCYNWKVLPLKDVMIGDALNGYFTKPQNYDVEGNVGVICVSDVVNRKYTNVNALRRAFASEKDLQKYCVKYGDMLFCRSSLVKEGIGKASVIPPYAEKDILFECHVIKIALDMSRVIPEYLQALSITDFFRIQVIKRSKTATMTTIGQKDIASVNILLPPMELQKKFTKFSSQIDKSKYRGTIFLHLMEDVSHML